MDVLKLLVELEERIEEPKSYFGFIKLDRDDAVMKIAKIRASLPQEIKEAASTVREQSRILETANETARLTVENSKREAERVVAEARDECERLLEQGRFEQEKLVADSEVLKLSKAQAEEIRNSAERDALETRRQAEDYAYRILGHLEKVVGKVMGSIEAGKRELAQEEESSAPIPVRERIRVG